MCRAPHPGTRARRNTIDTNGLHCSPHAAHPFDPALVNRIVESVMKAAQPLLAAARSFALVTSPIARPALSRLLRPHLHDAPVLSFLEIPDTKPVEVVAVIGSDQPALGEYVQ